MMKTISDIADFKGKKILVRSDFDVPVGPDGLIEEPFRIKKQKYLIDFLFENGAKTVIAAHISAVNSYADLLPQINDLLGREVTFVKSLDALPAALENYTAPILLDNIRLFEGEKENDKAFAERLASGFDAYINNGFAVSHRNQASVSAVAEFLPAYAGPLMVEEVEHLRKAIEAPAEGKVVIMGGAKAETKVPVIKNFIGRAEKILIGGVVANDVLKAKGQDMGSSLVDENYKELLLGLDINDPTLWVPEDFIVFDNKILDIGDQTMRKYIDAIMGAKMIIWNGPMGLFENPAFARGTDELAKAASGASAFRIIGGGDTISAINRLGLLDKFNFVSTGGGAMLAFLGGEELPGLKALGYYDGK